jgi:hypothetical protein
MVEPTLGDILRYLGAWGNWLQALGIIVILWIVFELIALLYHRKRMKEVYAIKQDMKRIEGKIDRLLKRKK